MKTLKGWREEHGITIRELAARAGVATRTLVLTESKRQVPRLVTMRRIADALAVAPLEVEEFARAVRDTLGLDVVPGEKVGGGSSTAAVVSKPSDPDSGREEIKSVTEARIGRHTACKPMLDGTAQLIAGYKAFHDQEGKYTAIALQEMPDAVAVWYRFLTLYDSMLRREHASPFDDRDVQHKAWHLRLQLSSTAAATAKLVLDASLAGYYSQAFGLIRHMYETWQQMVYVRFNPAAAHQWYTPDGIRMPQEPAPDTITNGARKFARKDPELELNALEVERQIKGLNKGAHPSGLAVSQNTTGKPGWSQLGANFNRKLLAQAVSTGTVALALLLHETARSVPVADAWRTEFEAIVEARTIWFQAEYGATAS